MIQVVNSPNGNILFSTAHVYSTIIDASRVPAPTISSNTGTLFTPIYTDKGPTNVIRSFKGMNAYKSLQDTYGRYNIRRLGLSYATAILHAQSGGAVTCISVKHPSATNASFILNLVIESKNSDGTSIEKTLGWINPDGSGFIAEPNAGTDNAVIKKPSSNHIVHKIYTKRLSFEVMEMKDINSIDELYNTAETLLDLELNNVTPGSKRSFPIMFGMYNGKGAYGNNFKLNLSSFKMTVNGRPTFQANIYDTKEDAFVYGTKQQVSLNDDKLDIDTLHIESRFNEPYSTGDFSIRLLDIDQLNAIGKIIQNTLNSVTLFLNPTTAGVQATALVERIATLRKSFDTPEDTDLHALSYLDITNVSNLNEALVASKVPYSIPFTGGSEGLLSTMTKFDWDFQANVAAAGQPVENRYVVADMFSDAYAGVTDIEVMSLSSNMADYIVDIGYPTAVKKSMQTLAENRDDIQVLFNAPITYNEINEAINWKRQFNIEGRNYYYTSGNHRFTDPVSKKTIIVPTSFARLFNVLEHYKNGFSEPIAGSTNGALSVVIPNSDRALGNKALAENSILEDNGFTPFVKHMNGYLWANSQKANYLLTESSALQNFHNNSIVNRILKKLYISLQDELHKLNSAPDIAKINRKVSNDLDEFKTKVRSLSYTGFFQSSTDFNIGLMTHAIDIEFFNPIKWHNIKITALPSTM